MHRRLPLVITIVILVRDAAFAKAKERTLYGNQLNRHAILHGESLDYGTFENSCRAISLLSYSGWALRALIPGASVRDDLARAYRDLPSVADDARRFAARALAGNPDAKPYLTLGLLTVADVALVESLTKANARLFDYSLDASSIKHVQDVHGDAKTEVMRGQRAVTAADYARLPELLNTPDSTEYGGISDVGHPIVRIAKLIDGEFVTAAFEIRGKRKMLALQSLWIKAGASSR